MNEIKRIGNTNGYIELSVDYDNLDYHKYTWWFQELLGGDQYSNKEIVKAMKEVIEILEARDDS